MYLEIICLFVNDYLNSEQFEELFFNNIFEYEKILDNKAYLEVIDTNFNLSYKVISLKNYLKTYLITNYYNEINIINDSYVDMIVNSNRTDVVAEILKSHYTKREIVYINCDLISNQADLIRTIKDSLQFSEICGNNWDAINDLIYDVILPKKLIFKHWNKIELRFPTDTKILKQIFNDISKDRCKIFFE